MSVACTRWAGGIGLACVRGSNEPTNGFSATKKSCRPADHERAWISMHRVLLTGAGGFVGSHLARLLLAEGQEGMALISPSTNRWRLRDIESRLSILDSDLTNLAALGDRLRAFRPDVCLHMAWHGWAGQTAPDENLTSLAVSLELLKLMSSLRCERFVAAGTCFEYDVRHEWLSEKTPLGPHNVYGACKKAMFEIAQEFAALTGIRVLTPRLFYSYGPYEPARRIVASIIRTVLGGGTAKVTPGQQIRDYLHIEDVASAIWTATQSPVTGAVNIASGEPVTIAEVATTLGQLLGKPDRVEIGAIGYQEGDPMRVAGDATLLRRETGWSPRFGLRDGLANAVAWWEAWSTQSAVGASGS
ncbi:MAG: UDP-glucose 4-epimerase [Acidobacteria bacterium]|nr:UDP-glucose 4-epimerase [Acidobacteriota bacterium]